MEQGPWVVLVDVPPVECSWSRTGSACRHASDGHSLSFVARGELLFIRPSRLERVPSAGSTGRRGIGPIGLT